MNKACGTGSPASGRAARLYFLSIDPVRDHHCYHGSAALIPFDGQTPSAHHFKPLPDVFKRNTRDRCFIGIKTFTVVHNDDLAAGICFPRLDQYVKGLGIGIPAVLDGVFHDGLQGQCRDTE